MRDSEQVVLLHKGDNNTEYFHAIANGRRRKNTTMSFVGPNGVVEGEEKLIEHATEYYKDLFGPGHGNSFNLDPDMWEEGEKITEEDNTELTKPFTEKEIKDALFQMEVNKAVGPDGIPIEFYQSCWEIIKAEAVDLFEEFHNGGLQVSRLNYGVITLLPKVSDAEKFSNTGLYVC
jgi:hypothetical protein